jgi:hypothetical protein
MYFNKFKDQILLVLITTIISLFFWSTFYFNIPGKIGFSSVNLETLFSNYDGPNYIVIAKCFYEKNCIGPNFSLPLPLEYYPAHFPGYPLTIKFFNLFTTGPKAMIFSTLLGSILLTLSTYYLFRLFLNKKKSFYLSLLFLFFPARFLVLRVIGAPETWFLSFIILSLLNFKKDKFFLSALFASLALLFKTPAVLLGLTYLIYFFIDKRGFADKFKKYIWYLLMPLTLFLIFAFYQQNTGNFFAYFHSGDNFHLNPLPYLVFISQQTWVNTIWLEDIIYIYLFALIAIYYLFKKYKLDIITIFATIFIFSTLLVSHRDISRYISPVYPFMILAFSKFLNKKEIKIILLLLIPAIILFAINHITGNTTPIADWSPYL